MHIWWGQTTWVVLVPITTHIPSFIYVAHEELWIFDFFVISQSEQICKWSFKYAHLVTISHFFGQVHMSFKVILWIISSLYSTIKRFMIRKIKRQKIRPNQHKLNFSRVHCDWMKTAIFFSNLGNFNDFYQRQHMFLRSTNLCWLDLTSWQSTC